MLINGGRLELSSFQQRFLKVFDLFDLNVWLFDQTFPHPLTAPLTPSTLTRYVYPAYISSRITCPTPTPALKVGGVNCHPPFPRWAHGHSVTCPHRGGCTVAIQSGGECYRCMEWVCVCWCVGAGPNQATYGALFATSVLYFGFERYGLRRQSLSPDDPSVPSQSVCIRRGHGAPGGGLHRRHGASPPSHSFYPPAAWW